MLFEWAYQLMIKENIILCMKEKIFIRSDQQAIKKNRGKDPYIPTHQFLTNLPVEIIAAAKCKRNKNNAGF